MPKINLHAHTVNSDGQNTLQEMAEAAKALGHSALVITDHDSARKAAFQANRAELRLLKENKLIDYRVIIGAEIMTPFGEYLLFGTKANKNWAQHRANMDLIRKQWGPEKWVEFFKEYVIFGAKDYTYGLIMCHPRSLHDRTFLTPATWWPLVHGFEKQNALEDYTDESKYPGLVAGLRKRMPCALELTNSDAHRTDNLPVVCNETAKPITDESQLIAWLTNTRKGKK